MFNKNDGKGMAPFAIVVTILIFLVGAYVAIHVFLQVMEPATEDVACQHFCELRRDATTFPGLSMVDPRAQIQPGEMGCYCGVRDNFGQTLHINVDMSSYELKAFHVTNLNPTTLSGYQVPGNTDLSNDCDFDEAGWETIEVDYPDRCFIFAVDRDDGITGSDECDMYAFEPDEDATLDYGYTGDSIRQVLGDYDGDASIIEDDNDVLDDLDFGSEVELNFGDGMRGQVYLLHDITFDGHTTDFVLFDNVTCTEIGGEAVWSIGDPDLEPGDPDELDP